MTGGWRKTASGSRSRGDTRRLKLLPAWPLRVAAALILVLTLIGATGASATAFPGIPTIPTPASNILMVSDSVAKKVYFYRVPEMTLTGQLDNVDLGSVHGGIITLPELKFPSAEGGVSALLPGGRVIVDDVPNQQVLIVHLNIKGEITSVDRVPADLGDEVPWTAVDPTFRYYAAPSLHFDGNLNNTVNLIDLKTLQNTRIPVTMSQDEDPHPFLVGNPANLTLFVSLGDRIDGFKVRDVRNGNLAASSSFPVDPGLAHGNFVSPETKTLGLTGVTGLEVIDFSCRKSCALTKTTTAPWKVSGFTDDFRSFRPRVTADGTRVVSSINASPLNETWATQHVGVHVTDLKTKEATRLEIGKGIGAGRFGLSKTLGAFTVQRPEADGDLLRLLDVNPSSQKYLQFVGDVTLPHLAAGPVEGVNPAGTQRRSTAVTPDGKFAFATFGGEGKIAVVDTASLQVTTLTVPTALETRGYITAFRLGTPPIELAGR